MDAVAHLDQRVARSRAKLLAAGTELLVESGPNAVTVDGVVARSGVAKTTLYRLWPTRTELLLDVLRSNFPEPPTPVLDRGFEHGLRAFLGDVAEILETPEHRRVLPALLQLKSTLAQAEEMAEAENTARTNGLQLILDLGVAEGALRPDPNLDVDLVGVSLVGPLMTAAMFGSPDIARIADYVATTFIDAQARKVTAPHR